MITLQRASAGSGKTYTLTRKYIWFLIAIRNEDGSWRLRTSHEIADGLPRILAITFTNKATNEMKLRIVGKLAELATADSPHNLPPGRLAEIDYLKDFCKELDATPELVGKTCREALSVLLNEYSDFKVSTIDSFFQTVLRTFTYESSLNDSYQVEIDSDFIAAAAVDATLNEIDSEGDGTPARYWLERLMKGEADKGTKTWNAFQKGSSSSVYGRLLASVKRLEKEDFKNVRDELDEYFDAPGIAGDPLREAYERGLEMAETPLLEALKEARRHAARLKSLFKSNSLDAETDGAIHLAGRMSKISRLSIYSPASDDFKVQDPEKVKSVFRKGRGAGCADAEIMAQVAREMYAAHARFHELLEDPIWKHWIVYAPQIPYLGLLGIARRKMKEYLDENNTIQLAETNSMLRRIIGEEDAPFVYERLGSRLDHFLIDEFQDTSRLQWENLRHLLHESDSRGEDNLIIGDAKQSIYRFRNADPSIITDTVPEEFPDRTDRGLSTEDNTNWRSDRTIVEFNNLFFSGALEKIAPLSKGYVDFHDLYANVVQHPSHRKREGFIKALLIAAPEGGPDQQGRPKKFNSTERAEAARRIALDSIGPLVVSILERGYRQSDIALLVRSNALAKEVINTLVAYNASLGPSDRRIEFISEESLLVSSSEAVGTIINILGKMTGAPLSPLEQVREYQSGESPHEAIDNMLAGMQTVALPALVEAITETFVPESQRHTQAVFIAALQDMVLEFCDSHSADVASFLEWWKVKGVARSISSPEGTDAVQVMTIHKSKGLEFKCVIIPYEDSSLIPDKRAEWRWVRPFDPFMEIGFPPYVEVQTLPSLSETIHSEVYDRFFDLYTMDSLNSLYVAFTRAVDELYIFTRLPEEKTSRVSLPVLLKEVCAGKDGELPIYGSDGNTEDILPVEMIEWSDFGTMMTVGTPVEIEKRQSPGKADSSSNLTEERFLTAYPVNSSPSVLRYVEQGESGPSLITEEDEDPRSDGSLLHTIMSLVIVPSDLHRAVLTMRMRGMISGEKAVLWEKSLAKAISDPRVSSWFGPEWRVINERDIIFPGQKNRRPDRIMLSRDRRRAVVVDYKFGEIPDDDRHGRQIRQYSDAIRETLNIRDVEAYVWYVRKQKILRIPVN